MDRISQMNKTELRHFFKARRASLNIDEVSQRSRQINQNFIDNLLPKIYQKNSAKIF
jgi:5-formyltetrahydrofolate cyclo-ligase